MSVTLARPTYTDDDGSGTTGSVENAAFFVDIFDRIDVALALLALATVAPAVSTVTTTGNITALPLPVGTGDLVILMNNATIATIQGIAAGLSGQKLKIISYGAGQVDLAHQNGSASAANKLINWATSGNTPLAAGSGVAELTYDATATRWRLTQHEQGAYISVAYASGNFTGSGTIVWTVDVGDQVVFKYKLSGRTLHIILSLQTTTVSGTGTELRITLPLGLTAAAGARSLISVLDNNVAHTGIVDQSATTYSRVNTDTSSATNWAASTNQTQIIGDYRAEVT